MTDRAAPRPGFRLEKDPLGTLEVPEDAYYGVQTERAIRNFPISGRRPDIALVRAAVNVKKAAARANHATGRLPDHLHAAIVQAADEILAGLGIGSGRRGDYAVVSPNDHVNMAQSTNDTFPTAMRVATLDRIREFMSALDELIRAFDDRARAFDGVLKSGRTHMQDAVPIRLGQEFAA